MKATDAEARERALDPGSSFVVQAPAGSGKTGLLTQRFLRLLSGVEAPEQIVAITFTLKAAAEMRRRILRALRGEDPDEHENGEHQRRTRELARAVREHARQLGWNLELHPARLRIQTIDAFCNALAAQSPLLSRAGADLVIAADARPLYLAAARRTLLALGDPDAPGAAIRTLLRHRDNQVEQTEQLVAGMLERRDQWLPLVLRLEGDALRSRLERDLRQELVGHLRRIIDRWPGENLAAICRIASQVAARTPGEGAELQAWRGNVSRPEATLGDLTRWRSLARLLLTRDGKWRRQLTVKQGFAQAAKADKEAMLDLVRELGRVESLDADLECIGRLPEPRIIEEQWCVAEALIAVLKHAAQELELEFRSTGRVDFTAVAQAALQALGHPDQPTDLALAVDYRIRHLLVDEFQDTSLSQYRLLESLTSGWTDGDGRTLFLVGDPMQSIYRFRQAEVGLFLRTRDRGLGSLRPRSLVLDRNFRSQASLVGWFNDVFERVLPRDDDVARGAVRHAPSQAAHEAEQPSVAVYPLFDSDLAAEAAEVTAAVRELLDRRPAGSIGILARQRAHLSPIATALTAQGLRFQAVELEPLSRQGAVRDLMALSRALLHLGDRTAWLALLRSPVCGLTLADLTSLTAEAPRLTIWELIGDPGRIARLSADGRRRTDAVREVLAPAVAADGRVTLRRRVESAWSLLGGPACASNPRALEDAQAFLDRLDALEGEQPLPAAGAFEALFAELFARADPQATGQVQLMTVHKAKGLEFDAVFLVGLGRGRQDQDQALLHWMEVAQPDGAPGLLLAPIRRKGSESDPLSAYVEFRVNECEGFERARLLYVAVTRARQELHLFGHVAVRLRDGAEEMTRPERGSGLALLWHALEGRFADAFVSRARLPARAMTRRRPGRERTIRRLADGWSLPQPGQALAPSRSLRTVPEPAARPDFDWASETTRHVGTVVHLELERWSKLGGLPAPVDVERSRERFGRLLRACGVPAALAAEAIDRVITALQATLADERGRWIFDPRHREARSELALSGVIDEELVSVIVDRTFLDVSGTRWVVDFKTSAHLGGDLDVFLDNEMRRYREQLDRYALLVGRGGAHPVRCGLYFPLLKSWREW